MIKINIKKKDNIIESIVIKGHACFANIGKDIVCSAVSSIVITTINALIRIDENSIDYIEKEAFIDLKILKKDDISQILVNNMIYLLNDLEKRYPKNLKIKWEV